MDARRVTNTERDLEAAKQIPSTLQADWRGSNHYELQNTAREADSWWWLDVCETFQTMCDWQATEDGKRMGYVLEAACAAPRLAEAYEQALKRIEGLENELNA